VSVFKKDEIILRLKDLTCKVKKPGRAFSAMERNEMKKEISSLNIELEKIKIQEDVVFILDFELENPLIFSEEIKELKIEIDSFANKITSPLLHFILEEKLKKMQEKYSELFENRENALKQKCSLKQLLEYEETLSAEAYRLEYRNKHQKLLAFHYQRLIKVIEELRYALMSVNEIILFFGGKAKLNCFVFLTDPIFTEASDFDNGYSIVEKNSQKMYFTFEGKLLNIDTIIADIPKHNEPRVNPELVPFVAENCNFERLFGYKNAHDEIIVPAKYKSASIYNNGFAKVSLFMLNRQTHFYGLLDGEGREVLACEFIEIGEVYNDIVLYKKHIYEHGWVRDSFVNFDMSYRSKHLGFFCGYLKLEEVRPTIERLFNKTLDIEKSNLNLNIEMGRKSILQEIESAKKELELYVKSITG